MVAFTKTAPKRSVTPAQIKEFINEVIERMLALTAKMPPGEERLRLNTLSYLDTCVEHCEARRSLSDVDCLDEEARALTNQYRKNGCAMMERELSAMGVKHHATVATQLRKLVEDVVIKETTRHAVIDHERERIWSFIDRLPRRGIIL